MTIAEKIIRLRTSKKMSQEKLANLLGVSRQAVSRWEAGESIPGTENIKEICKLFSVSSDQLLRDDLSIRTIPPCMPEISESDIQLKYFGTDGFRGNANVELTTDHAYKIGRFLGWYYGQASSHPKVVIGKDTRRSSYALEYSVAAGLASSGADVCLLHVTTTPSVSYVIRQDGFDCGIMITASHNPYHDNGIKVINGDGEKLDDKVAYLIESYLDGNLDVLGVQGDDLPFASEGDIGSIEDYSAGRNRYIGYLISLAKHSLRSLRIGLDCANGSSWMIAKSVFQALGAQVTVIGDSPDGMNINRGCGSTHIEALKELVLANHLDMGFAFDGDADRCLAVDEKGMIVDGDKILYLLAKKLKDEGALEGNAVVATIMSNSGLAKALKQEGISCVATQVGDRFVYERMLRDNFSLGGEQSGHIIIKKICDDRRWYIDGADDHRRSHRTESETIPACRGHEATSPNHNQRIRHR